MFRSPLLAAALAVTAFAPALAAAETAAPLQAVMHEVDGARVMAFFTPASGRCETMIMPDEGLGRRISASLAPGASTTIEGPAGSAMVLTCGTDAASMRVERRVPTTSLASR